MNKEIWAIYKINITSGDEEMKFVAIDHGSCWKDAMTAGFGNGWSGLSDDLS